MNLQVVGNKSAIAESEVASIVNLHRRETANIGDRSSAPCLYFEELANCRPLEVSGWKREEEAPRNKWRNIVENAKIVIYGGGGLLEFEKYKDSLEYVASCKEKNKKQKHVIWGAGHNISSLYSWSHLKARYKYDYSNFDLIGVRDSGHRYDWVPCASCMSPVFDQPAEPQHEFVFFFNKGTKDFAQYMPKDAPADASMGNIKTNLFDVISFLASGETVVTSSYHGAYWAQLLGRKVVGIPTSSKFYDLRHPIPLCQAEDWRRYAKLARSFSEALSECREANIQFKNRVLDLL